MSSGWHKLHIQAENLPSLLFQYTWTRKGYELYMTDLTSIWAEQLSHKDILERAEQGSTTIDPSEGDDQLDLLLTKIGEALDGSNGKPSINSGSRADSIKINISAKLPAPLRPLNWYLNLSKESASSLTKLIILPLLKDEAAWESRQQLLLDQLRQKDWVLSKVFDRIEALGIEMGSIFPSAAGLRSAKKANTRSELAKLIKGVAPFDEQAWLTQSKDCYDGSSAASNIAHELFGSKNERSTADSNPVRDNWWTELGNSTIAAQEGTGQPPKGSDARMPSPSPAKDSVTQEVKHSDPDLDDGDITAETTDSEFEVCEVIDHPNSILWLIQFSDMKVLSEDELQFPIPRSLLHPQGQNYLPDKGNLLDLMPIRVMNPRPLNLNPIWTQHLLPRNQSQQALRLSRTLHKNHPKRLRVDLVS